MRCHHWQGADMGSKGYKREGTIMLSSQKKKQRNQVSDAVMN